MKVVSLLNKSDERQVSVEIEPPTLGRSIDSVFRALDPLVQVGVKYVNITYHAEQIVDYVNTNNSRFPISRRRKPGTVGVAGAIQSRYASKNVEAVPHVICTSFTKYDIEEYLIDLGFLGVQNVIALRGDSPRDQAGKKDEFTRSPGGHAHANELIRQIVDLKNGLYIGAEEGDPLDFCVGAACYPEGHPESRSLEDDIRWTKEKVDSGAEYLVTQMFFDNNVYRRFVERARTAGINVPIVPGVKPLTSKRQLQTISSTFMCSIPEELKRAVNAASGEADVKKVGVEWCIRQCQELLIDHVPGIHVYAARGAPVKEIIERVFVTR